MRTKSLLYIFFGYYICVTSAKEDDRNETKGLRCYACASTGPNNKCGDFNTYKIAMDGKGNERVKKTCTPPYNKTCIIERYESNGNDVSHIRGCSDNEHFSFTSSNKTAVFERLGDLQMNNETACVWDGKHLVCLTKCNTTFCNGPILDEINSATLIKFSSVLILVVFLATEMFQQ